ncbi:MAG: response regulator transcription factor [Thaumarchaeota archaeon]|nr:MAG: response regulator transcription factor [Nitrososphaerota archaeon]TLX95661.1 MAG: response regulator transcription factor [Nitrososphaerota archaeon]
MKILVVDDNSSITELLAMYFKKKGHDCITTNDGKEGLSLCMNNKFDAIILDLAMPEFTGKDFLDSLIQEGKIEQQKIIVLTAMPLGNVKIEDHRHGICEVLPKPCKLDVLMKTLESLTVAA